jgi:hypothetical protein
VDVGTLYTLLYSPYCTHHAVLTILYSLYTVLTIHCTHYPLYCALTNHCYTVCTLINHCSGATALRGELERHLRGSEWEPLGAYANLRAGPSQRSPSRRL